MAVKGRVLVIADGVPALDVSVISLKTGFKSALKGQITPHERTETALVPVQ